MGICKSMKHALVDCNSRNRNERRLPGDQDKTQSTAIVTYREHLQRSHERRAGRWHSVFYCYSPLITQQALLAYEGNHLFQAIASTQICKHKRTLAAHAFGVPGHDVKIGTYMWRQVGFINDE